jgi:hypothetical protein
MTTTNKPYNPFFRATRAAFAELTTSEAWHWYLQQIITSAAITYQGLTLIRRWLTSNRGQVAAVIEPVQAITISDDNDPEQVIAPAETAEPESVAVPANWLAVEANDFAAVEPVQAIAPTEPPPSDLAATEAGEALDYEVVEDGDQSAMAADEGPLLETETPFTDELESGPPFIDEDEDLSFFQPEDDEALDSLLHKETVLESSVGSELPLI